MIFTATDPHGYQIILTRPCWFGHILLEHPEMTNKQDEVRRCVEEPDFIYESKRKLSSHLHFLRSDGDHVRYVLVVVDVQPKFNRGYVQTAFLVDSLSKGGRLIWEKR